MKPEKWTIYCHTHIESSRRYVGLTKNTVMHRWNQHCAQAINSKGGRWHFPNAIRKYGKDAFFHEVLEVCDSLEAANLSEQRWVEHFKTRDPQFGFNLTKGGAHTPHKIRKNPWNDPEYRAKGIKAAKNRWLDPNYRKRVIVVGKTTRSTPEYKKKASTISKEVHSRPEVKAKLREVVLKSFKNGVYSTESFKSKLSENGKRQNFSPERLENLSKTSKKLWENRNYQNKVIKSQKEFWSSPKGQQVIKNKNKKISASLMGKRPSKATMAKIIGKRRINRIKRYATRTCIICKIHGKILLTDNNCYKRPKPIDGFFRYECKICKNEIRRIRRNLKSESKVLENEINT